MQGGIVSPSLFNVVVDNVVRTWLEMTVEDQLVAHEVLGLNMGICVGFFYAYNGMIRTWDSEWLQNALNILISLFRRYGIVTSITKSWTMACKPGALWSAILEEAVGWKFTLVEVSYREQLQRRIICPKYGVELTGGYMTAHRRRMHRTETAINWNRLPVSQKERLPQVYDVRFPRGTTQFP